MNTQYIKNIVSLVLLYSFFISSCKKDFLDEVNDNSVLLRQEYVVDLNTTSEYLNGIYTKLGSDLFGAYAYVYPEVISDNIKPVTGASGTTPLLNHYNWQQMADNTQTSLGSSSLNCNGISYSCYQLIRASWFTIESAEKFKNQDPSRANLIKGQALAIKAFCEFTLINTFAQPYAFTSDASHLGIVLVKSSNWTEGQAKRASVDEVYKNLVESLLEAKQLLKASPRNKFTFDEVAVMALLSRVYLYKGDFALCKQLALEALKETPLMVTGYPQNLFTKDEMEAIFQIPPATSSVNQYSTIFASVYFRFAVQFVATEDIASLLSEDPSDVRRSWVENSNGVWTIMKFPEGVDPAIFPAALSYFQTVFRSSELCLNAAESYMKLNQEDSAAFYLDMIRKRASSSAQSTVVRGNSLTELIYKERRKEFAFEGFRMYDLLRWKRDVSRIDVLNGGASKIEYGSERLVAPLPELDVKSGIDQNKGY